MFDKIVRVGHKVVTKDEYFAAREYIVSGLNVAKRHVIYREQGTALLLGLYFREPPSSDSLPLDTPTSQAETQSTPHYATTVKIAEAGFHGPSGSGLVKFLGSIVTPEGIDETELDAMVNAHGELVTDEGIIYGFFAETSENIAELATIEKKAHLLLPGPN